MKKTIKKKIPTIDEISEMAADGKDVSEYFTNKFRVRPPLRNDGASLLRQKGYEGQERPPQIFNLQFSIFD